MPGYAAADLGLGDMLGRQQVEETEEQKRRRLAEQRAQQGAMSPAVNALFGGFGAFGY